MKDHDGLNAIQKYVEGGGRCVGVCAGAYLLCETVEYDGQKYPYPLGLFDGMAKGPVKGLTAYPEWGAAKLTLTDAGKKRALNDLDGAEVAYSGGPCFEKGTGVGFSSHKSTSAPPSFTSRVTVTPGDSSDSMTTLGIS